MRETMNASFGVNDQFISSSIGFTSLGTALDGIRAVDGVRTSSSGGAEATVRGCAAAAEGAGPIGGGIVDGERRPSLAEESGPRLRKREKSPGADARPVTVGGGGPGGATGAGGRDGCGGGAGCGAARGCIRW